MDESVDFIRRIIPGPESFVFVVSTPANGYVAENGTTFYVAEDGVTYYVQET